MIKSMTGFGRGEQVNDDRKIVVEIKAVNHRFCDMNVKLPKKLNYFETDIRTCLKEYIQRGKVDVFITYEDYTKSNVCVKYNKEIATEYVNYLNSMVDDFGLQSDVKPSVIGRFPEVFTLEEQSVDENEIWSHLEGVVREAAEKFVESRIREGENLKKDILAKLTFLEQEVAVVEERSPQIVAEYRQKLEEKVTELLADTQMEENRLAAEVILYADKICTDEEVVRLKSHIQHMRATLEEKEGIGRKLDFIAQEMNREANTILSKANDIEVSNHAISLKTEIEKIREQIQNIE